MDNAFLTQLTQYLGTQHVLIHDMDMAPFCSDSRGRYQGHPSAVALPGTRDEIVNIINLAAHYQVPIVPQGGNTSTCGAATCDTSGKQLIINLRRLDRLLEIDTDNNTITVEAGITLKEMRAHAYTHQRLFPLSLASEGSCQIGGNLSTNAGGLSVLRYGTMRDLTLGLDAILPDGRRVNTLTGLRKDTTGLDIKQLFIGAEGQLGLITAATLKLFPAPTAHATALIGVNDITTAIHMLNALKQTFDTQLTTFEIMSQTCLQLVHQFQIATVPFDSPWTLLIEISDSSHQHLLIDQVVNWLDKQPSLLEGVIAMNETQRTALWQLRESLSHAQQRQGPSIKHDIAIPTSAIPSFIQETNLALQHTFPGCRIVVFGHAGDGSLHYNVSFTRPNNANLFDDENHVNKIVYDNVYALKGTLAAEHGIGQLKTYWLEHYKDPVSLTLMRDIKRLLDPHNLMNPGKWLSPGFKEK